MIYIAIPTIVIMFCVIVALLTTLNSLNERYLSSIEQANHRFYRFIDDIQSNWNMERSELLDRVQSPSFAEYKQAEIKMVKAQKDEEPKPSFILE